MDCCDNKNITYKNCENICVNCGIIHDYKYINEISFRDYNMNISNMLFYRKTIYKRKKYLYNKCFHIREINENIISKYLNSIYNFYCNKNSISYKPIFENKKIIDLNDDIIKILEKNYLLYPYYIKNEDDYYYL